MSRIDDAENGSYIDEMQPEPIVVTAWARLLRAYTSAMNQVESALKAAAFPSLAWYDVLLELDKADKPLRPNALESELLVEQYNLSRLLDRMEAQGLIERSVDPTDGRGRLVTLTEGGRSLRQRMWPVYADAIQKAMGDRLDAEQAEVLAKLLGQVAREQIPA